MENNEIKAISILASGKCNLNCNYCFLHKNQSLKDIDTIVQKSWENGQYLKNLQHTLIKLQTDFTAIEGITIWGGEPLLNLINFNKNIVKILDIFPNINSFWTSSNFNINIEDFIQLLKIIDENVNNEVEFRLQLSIDGIFYKEGHNLPLNFYKQQLKKLIELTQSINFKKINLRINFRATISESNFLLLFNDEQLLDDYIQYMLELINYINSFTINKHIKIINTILPIAAYPSQSNTIDGVNLSKALQIWDRIKHKYKLSENLYDEGLGRISNNLLFKNNYECKNLLQNVTILPDGSITCCINSFLNNFDLYKNELKTQNDIEGLKLIATEIPYSFNPINMSDEEINKRIYFIQNGVKNTISTYTYFALKMCEELLKVNQISNIYNNTELLLQHINLINLNLGCMFYNLHETQLPYLNSPSTFRKYLNGAAEYAASQQSFNIDRSIK